MVDRITVIESARRIVIERESEYGGASKTLNAMAEMFSLYLGHPVEAHDVALIEIIQKVVRLKQTRGTHADSWIDIAGYAAIGAEAAFNDKETRQNLELVKERLCVELGLDPIQAEEDRRQAKG
jgi:hypothetical protein